jgi:hypothetical protein
MHNILNFKSFHAPLDKLGRKRAQLSVCMKVSWLYTLAGALTGRVLGLIQCTLWGASIIGLASDYKSFLQR